MELFDNIRNCNKNATAVKKAKKREKRLFAIILGLAGSTVGLGIANYHTRKDVKEAMKTNMETNNQVASFGQRLANAKDALLGKDGKIIDTTGTETDFTEINEEVTENDN